MPSGNPDRVRSLIRSHSVGMKVFPVTALLAAVASAVNALMVNTPQAPAARVDQGKCYSISASPHRLRVAVLRVLGVGTGVCVRSRSCAGGPKVGCESRTLKLASIFCDCGASVLKYMLVAKLRLVVGKKG